ncbi:olfactory receptor 6X1-like [Elgaria multicarinata webbii]|uniref:olfactory receptor 6X1-like n=1 Tax=Elgaria multicarinata webbii TaxID=159646 RepID=UPI002FCD3A6E
MDLSNCTTVTAFTLVGLPHFWGTNIISFAVVLLLYLLCITGNGLIIAMVSVDRQLQKPMYFFLSNLSLMESGHITAFIPKMLVNSLAGKNTICFYCCMAQLYFYFLFGVSEFFVISLMSFDRYLAICHPLRYNTIMTSSICLKLAVAAWFGGFFSILFQMIMLLRLPFCNSNMIDHYYCDSGAVLRIAGGDTHIIEALSFLITVAVVLGSMLCTLVSYIFIISTILRIPSASGQWRAFSTCASHLTVASILYGSVLFIYLRPTVLNSSFSIIKTVSVLNTIVTPVLNPFIYTIRNNEFKDAVRKALGRKSKSSYGKL